MGYLSYGLLVVDYSFTVFTFVVDFALSAMSLYFAFAGEKFEDIYGFCYLCIEERFL
jgi:hypothetical protein